MFYFWYRFVLENFDLTFGLMYTVGNHGICRNSIKNCSDTSNSWDLPCPSLKLIKYHFLGSLIEIYHNV